MDPIISCWRLVESHRAETRVKEAMEKPARACGQPTADGSTAGRKPQALLGAGLALARGLAMAFAHISAQRLYYHCPGAGLSFLAFFLQKPYSIMLPFSH